MHDSITSARTCVSLGCRSDEIGSRWAGRAPAVDARSVIGESVVVTVEVAGPAVVPVAPVVLQVVLQDRDMEFCALAIIKL